MTGALPASLLIHTATWTVPTTSTDAHGNTVRIYVSGTSISGRFEQTQGTEPTADGRAALVRQWKFFTNQDGISGHDRITFGSLVFEVDGPPAPVYGGSGFHHAEVALKLVDG